MWKVIQEILPFLLVVLFLSQYVLPVIFNKKTWWLFRPKSKTQKETTTNPLPLIDEIKTVKTVVDEAKAKAEIVKDKAKGNLKSAEDLKNEADKL